MEPCIPLEKHPANIILLLLNKKLQKSNLKIIKKNLFSQGQYFSGGNYRIYLLGNPIIWWSNLVFLGLFLFTLIIAAIKHQRGYDANEKPEIRGKRKKIILR